MTTSTMTIKLQYHNEKRNKWPTKHYNYEQQQYNERQLQWKTKTNYNTMKDKQNTIMMALEWLIKVVLGFIK